MGQGSEKGTAIVPAGSPAGSVHSCLGQQLTSGLHLKIEEQNFEKMFIKFEQRHKKTGLQGFQPGLTQTRLYNHRPWPEA